MSIDRKRKQPATLLLRALGIADTREEIIDILGSSEMVLRTLDRDPATTKEEALIELYKRFRPGEPPTIDSARTLLDGLFFNPQRYDLAKVGRYKANKKLGFDPEFDASTLTIEDIVATMRYIVATRAKRATRSTTSTTSATVVSARSASSSRTSSASAFRAWSALCASA